MKKLLIALGCVAAVGAGVAGYAVAASSSDPAASCDPPSYDGTNLTLHCIVPQATNTVTDTATVTNTETQTVTETATTTETVPGPTVTETQTVTVTPTPTPTTTPPPSPFAPGQARDATNTGYAGDGVAAADLTLVSGNVTYGTAFSGQTISLKAYTGTVTVSGSNITIKDCSLTFGGLNMFGFRLSGNNDTVQNCTITAPAGQSLYEPVFLNPGTTGNQVLRNNISRGENLLTTYGANAVIEENWMHDVALDSNPGDHPDGIEVYGGGPVLIQDNRIVEGNPYDAPINVAPWGSYKVQGLTVTGNFLDNGQSLILLDNQNGNSPCSATQPVGDCLINTRVTGNAFGGHQCTDPTYCFGIYHPSLNYERRPFVQTEADLTGNPNAVLWPTTGADVNRWEESSDLTPNRNDQIVTPT